MSSKRNQTIAIARFLMYKYGLNQQLEGMTDEEYLAHPIGLDVGQYVADLMKYCPEHIVDQVMEHQDALLRRLGTDYLTVILCLCGILRRDSLGAAHDFHAISE